MEIKQYIERLLEEVLEGRSYFVTDLNIYHDKKKIEIFMDDEELDISIDEFAKMSRYLLNRMEEDQHKAEEYVLEMSSPGIGTPIRDLRQYKKNLNRYIQINHEDKVSEGKLIAASEEELELEAERPKKSNKKQMETFSLTIPFDTIKESKLIIRF